MLKHAIVSQKWIGTLLDDLEEDLTETLWSLWRAKIAIGIKTFGWRMFLNRLSNRDQLRRRRRRILHDAHDPICLFGFYGKETLDHILFQCLYLTKFGRQMEKWIGK